jgi:hypothetical protein
MNARTRNTRRGSPTRWIAAGAVVLVLGLAGPAGAALAAEPRADEAVVRQAVGQPKPTGKPGNGPNVAQPDNPCLASAPPPGCNPRPKDPTPTFTPTPKPKPPTNTPVPEPTSTPVPKPPTDTPVPPPTSTPADLVTIDVPEPEVAAAPPAEEPTPEPTPEPTATPVPPTATPLAPTATATATSTATAIVVAAVADPPAEATPLPPTPEPTEPAGEVEIAGSPLSDPSPFILLGTLLFALAAAAGQVLRADPGMFRRFVDGLDGVRRLTGRSIGGGAGAGTAPAIQSAGGLGGHGGGLDGLTKGSPNDFDRFAKGAPTGFEAGGFGGGDPGLGGDVAMNAGGQVVDVQADSLNQNALRPTDWGTGGPPPAESAPRAPVGGSLGGGADGSELGRISAGSGSELASGGLGGTHGGDPLARGVGVTGDALANGAGLPSTPGPQDVALQSTSGGEADLAERLDNLARSISSVEGANVADAGTTAASDRAASSATGFEPSWLGAGALARAPRQDPVPRTFRCPQCRRPLVYGHRFCGYCGEPLDKTLA